MDYFDDGQPFCGNPECLLHVRAGDAGVRGSGNWAVIPGGLIIGRGIFEGRILCDVCGREHIAEFNIAGSPESDVANSPRAAEFGRSPARKR